MLTLLQIAACCHAANAEYCRQLGDTSQPSWDDAPDWQKRSAIIGVIHDLTHPNVTPGDAHQIWLDTKIAEGWKWGLVKNTEAKEHPALRPYDELPDPIRAKDFLFLAVVRGLQSFWDGSLDNHGGLFGATQAEPEGDTAEGARAEAAQS